MSMLTVTLWIACHQHRDALELDHVMALENRAALWRVLDQASTFYWIYFINFYQQFLSTIYVNNLCQQFLSTFFFKKKLTVTVFHQFDPCQYLFFSSSERLLWRLLVVFHLDFGSIPLVSTSSFYLNLIIWPDLTWIDLEFLKLTSVIILHIILFIELSKSKSYNRI